MTTEEKINTLEDSLITANNLQQLEKHASSELETLGVFNWVLIPIDFSLPHSLDCSIGNLTTKQLKALRVILKKTPPESIFLNLKFQLPSRKTAQIIRFGAKNDFLNRNLSRHSGPLETDQLYIVIDIFRAETIAGSPSCETLKTSVILYSDETESQQLLSDLELQKYNVMRLFFTLNKLAKKRFHNQLLALHFDYEKYAKSRELELLTRMTAKDLNIGQAAAELQMTRITASRDLAGIREYFESSTTHTALIRAIDQGFIKI